MKKTILIFICIIGTMIILPTNVSAKTLQNLYDELSGLEGKLSNAKNNQALTEGELNKINAELGNLSNSIVATQNEITAANKKIAESEKQIDEKREETNELLKFLQLSSGTNVYLEYLFDAEDYTDFIYRFAIVSQLSEYNTTLMSDLEILINDLESSKVTLKSKEKELQSQRESYVSKMNTLRANLSTAKQEGTTIEEDIADMKKEIKYYVSLGCKRNSDLTKCALTPNAKGWRYPLGSGFVTSEYSGSSDRGDAFGGTHYGIDLSNGIEGSNVYAAAAGTVARIVYRSSCGGNQIYINHVVNGSPYTSAYMHLLNVNVSMGQVVTDSTVIGTMGGGSTSSKRGGYDNCTTGAHLHFGLSKGNNGSNYGMFITYSFNPRNIFSFPNGRFVRT